MESFLMKQVLLVEDDERLSSLISQYLTEHDFVVKCLSNGEKLLRQIQTSPPDILLLDVMLPGENGFVLCQKVRPYYSGPLLFMTAKNDDFDQVFGL
jgi:two-component system OmpR family response regulator/two-component system response regulator RstA